MRNKTGLIIGAIVLFSVLLIAKKNGYIGSDDTLVVETEKVFSGTITETVPANGKIQPEVEVKISPDV